MMFKHTRCLLLAGGVALSQLAGMPQALAGMPHPTHQQIKQEQQTRQVHEALDQLQRQAREVARLSDDMQQLVAQMAIDQRPEMRQENSDLLGTSASTLQILRDEQGPAALDALRAWLRQRHAVAREAEAYRQTLLRLAATPLNTPAQREAQAQAQAQADSYRLSQAHLQDTRLAWDNASMNAFRTLRQLDSALSTLVARQDASVWHIKTITSTWQLLAQRWQTMQASARLARKAGYLPGSDTWPAQLATDTSAPWAAQVAALPSPATNSWGALWPVSELSRQENQQVEAVARTIDHNEMTTLLGGSHSTDPVKFFLRSRALALRMAQLDRERQQALDAMTWVATLQAGSGPEGSLCTRPAPPASACEHWEQEAQAQQAQLAEAAYDKRLDALQDEQSSLSLTTLQLMPQTLAKLLDDIRHTQPVLAQLTAQIDAQIAQVNLAQQQTSVWQQQVTERSRVATARWEQARLAVFGPLRQTARSEPDLEMAAGGGWAGPSDRTVTTARSSALHRLVEANSEPAGFNGYTYVVVATGADMRSPGVRSRILALSQFLSLLPRSTEVDRAAQAYTHLFVLPVGAQPAGPDGLAYDVRMAQSLLLGMPPGWRMPAPMQRAFSTGQGPFLVSLPDRIGQVKPDTPLLFADLSDTPAEAVPDVAKAYMSDLLAGFSADQPDWQPRTSLRMALSVVRMVKSTGMIVQSVFPSASARPVTSPP